MNSDFSMIPIWVYVVLVLVLMTQSIWVFNDARKRKMNYWLWGLLCLMNTPTNVMIYLIVSRTIGEKHSCSNCHKLYHQSYHFCPYCGTEKRIQDTETEDEGL